VRLLPAQELQRPATHDSRLTFSSASSRLQRIRKLETERAAEKAAFEAARARQGEGGSRLVGFAHSTAEYAEHVFKQDTVGLQTKEQFAEKARLLSPPALLTLPLTLPPQRANVERELEAQRARAARASEEAEAAASSRRRAAAKASATARLSFVDPDEEAAEEEEEEEAPAAVRLANGSCSVVGGEV